MGIRIRRLIYRPGLICFSGFLLLVILWYINPVEAQWFPQCILKKLTGFDCPSCGASRAIHALLNGNFKEALNYNFFLIIGIIYTLGLLFVNKIRNQKIEKFRTILTGRMAAYTYVVLFFSWWIVRNILEI